MRAARPALPRRAPSAVAPGPGGTRRAAGCAAPTRSGTNREHRPGVAEETGPGATRPGRRATLREGPTFAARLTKSWGRGAHPRCSTGGAGNGTAPRQPRSTARAAPPPRTATHRARRGAPPRDPRLRGDLPAARPPPHPRSIPKPPPAPGRSSPASPSTAAAAAARQSSTTRSAAIAAPGRRPPPRSLGLPGHRAPLRRRQPPPAGGHGRREAAGPGRAAPSGAAGPGRPPGSHRRRECGAPPRRRPPPPPPATPPQPARQSERPSRPAAPRPAPPYEGRRRPPAAQRGDPTGRAGTALRPRRGVNWRGRAWGSRARHRGRAAAGTERAPKPLCCRGLSAGSPRPAMHREEGALTARRGKSLHPETKRRFSSRSGEGTWPQMEVSGYRQPEAVPRSHPTALQRPLSLGPVFDGRFHSIL